MVHPTRGFLAFSIRKIQRQFRLRRLRNSPNGVKIKASERTWPTPPESRPCLFKAKYVNLMRNHTPNVYLTIRSIREAGRRHFSPSHAEIRSSKIVKEIQQRDDFPNDARVGALPRLRSLPANLNDDQHEEKRTSNFGMGKLRYVGSLDLQDKRIFSKYTESWSSIKSDPSKDCGEHQSPANTVIEGQGNDERFFRIRDPIPH